MPGGGGGAAGGGEEKPPPGPPGEAEAVAEVAPPPKKKQRGGGIVSRVWRGIFRGRRGEDYEKRLQYLSKEEASVHARLKRRAQRTRRVVRNLVVLSVAAEVAAVAYAIMTTRSLGLSWQMRAIRVLPIFILPGFSSVIYSTFVSFTRMLDRKDQKTLEKLRAERKEKIDELKERTNYYNTQKLIQKYDLDPAAKAAAATVLASKLGTDSGLKVHMEDEPKTSDPLVKSNNVELVQSSGLRNRKPSHARNSSNGSSVASQLLNEAPTELTIDGKHGLPQNQMVVEHYKGAGAIDGGWIARIAALLVGEDPSQSFALICGNCHMHNGLARKEDIPCIKYYCPHCHALNVSQQTEDQDSGSSSGRVSSDSEVAEVHFADSQGEVTSRTGQDLPVAQLNNQGHGNENS